MVVVHDCVGQASKVGQFCMGLPLCDSAALELNTCGRRRGGGWWGVVGAIACF